ncbi:MAG: AzlC family ABC transporter permease [Steroidobacteraceae bacterium]
MLPLSPGIFAWGLVTGVAMVKSGLSTLDATILSLLAYAGSAQLAAMPLIATLAPLWLVTLTAIIVNLRFVVYTALLRPHFTHLSTSRRLWLGYIVGDIMFVRFTTLLQQEPNYPHKVAYYTGGALANWVIWQVSSLIGIFAATAIPASWGLELAGTLALVALLVPLLRQWPALAGASAAAIVAVLANALPLRLGLLCGVVTGITVALLVDREFRRRGAPQEGGS